MERQARGGTSTTAMRVLPDLVNALTYTSLSTGGWQTVESWHPLPPGKHPRRRGSSEDQRR